MADAGRSRRARTISGGVGGRCLSDLTDDLLRHILFLAPVKDGAATAVLSRRWRWLWRTSGAVYIDSRSFTGGCSSRAEQERGPFLFGDAAKKDLAKQESGAFFHGAEKALAAAAAVGPIRRLTFSVAKDSKVILLTRWWSSEGYRREHNLMEALVSNPAARRVEELQLLVRAWWNTEFTLSFASLPSEALRVLRIVRCHTLTAGAAASRAFPMLVALHLENCSVPLVDLQSVVDAAPLLSKLHLASTYFSAKTSTTLRLHDHGEQLVVGRLRIPSVSVLVFTGCTHGYASLELDVPRLQCFTYKQYVHRTNDLSLKSQASLVHVDLRFTHDVRSVYDKGRTPDRELILFWRFIKNFSTTKHLKLRMDCYTTGGLVFTDKASRDELLGGLSFSLLEQLELEAETQIKSAMVMLADLLHCCPVVRDLRIKLVNEHRGPWIESSSIENKAGVEFYKSVSGFRNRRSRSMVSSSGPENDDKYQAADGIIIPGLMASEQPFSCLQSHLKRVSLHFCMDQPSCLGVKLAKFFAENAMVIQEIHIDDGCQEMLEHVNSSVRRWIANKDKTAVRNQLNV